MTLNVGFIANQQQPKIDVIDPIEQQTKQLQLKQLLTAQQDDQAQRAAISQSGGDAASYLKALAAGGNYKAYQAAQKVGLEADKSKADTALANAHAGKFLSDVEVEKINQHRNDLAGVNDPQAAAQWLAAGYKDPTIGNRMAALAPMDQALSRIPQDPAGFQQWKQQQALGATKYIEMNKPTYQTRNLGGTTDTISLPGLGGAPQVVSSMRNSVSPDASLQAATSRANNAANIAKDYKVAGMDGNGNFVGSADGKSPFQGIIDEIGTNQTAQSVALARTPPGIKSQILAEVRKQYPGYEIGDFAAKNTAIKAYADPNSKQAQSIQASNTALNHLDTMLQLSEAQKNGNIPLFNKIANAYAIQTGQAAPKNMKDAALMVGPEISKAVIGAGGGVGERGDFVQALGGNFSPEQIAGTASTMKELLGGRLSEVQRGYERSTGRKDFASEKYLSPAALQVLNARSGAAPASAAGGIPAQSEIDAEIARRRSKK